MHQETKARRSFVAALCLSICCLVSAGSVCAEAAGVQTQRPNILFIMSDDHAKQAIGCYGNQDIGTPGIDRLAREGMRFNHALTPNSFCTPSRAAVLTGKYSHKNGVTHLNQKFDGSQPTFPKLLQAAGYQTALFGKWHLLTQPTGFDHYCVMKMQGMPMNPVVWETGKPWVAWTPRSSDWAKDGRRLQGYNNDAITSEALKWLKHRDSDKPFCLLLHPKPPHEPYNPPPPGYEGFLKDATVSMSRFHFVADVMTMPSANGGIFFHTKYQDKGWPAGHEAQIDNSHKDPVRTGSIYIVAKNLEAPAQDNEWFKYEIIVRGKTIETKVDGKTVLTYEEPSDVQGSRKLSSGTIGIQAHDPGSVVLVKNVKVKPLTKQ